MTRAVLLVCSLSLLGCRSEPKQQAAPTKIEDGDSEPEVEPEHHLIRYACQGFDAAVAEDAPEARLLASSARHAVALGGERVEAATQRWALLPPQGLLELIDRYEQDARPEPEQCAGLRAHLDRMAQRAATR